MLRYTKTNKNSKVTEDELKCALGTNKTTIAYALETLKQIGLISYKRSIDDININITTPSRQTFTELIEYNLFVSELKEISKFREYLNKANLNELAKLLEKNELPVKERILTL